MTYILYLDDGFLFLKHTRIRTPLTNQDIPVTDSSACITKTLPGLEQKTVLPARFLVDTFIFGGGHQLWQMELILLLKSLKDHTEERQDLFPIIPECRTRHIVSSSNRKPDVD